MRQSLVVAAVAVALSPWPAEACGGGGVTTSEQSVAVADSQRIVLALHNAGTADARTEIVAQIGVPTAGADYGVLIPVPGTPVIDPEPVSIEDLDALDRATAPTIVTEQSDGDSGTGCGCGSDGDDDSGSKSGSPSSSVSVSAPVNVGPTTVVVLESDDGAALTAWLDENGFAIPAEHAALVDSYVESGHSFIAIRRSDTAPPDGPTSIGLHYTLAGDHRQLSLAFARLGAAPTVAFTVFITAPGSAFPGSDFYPLTLNDLPESTLHKSYSAAVAEAVAHRPHSHAFVMEGTYGPPLSSDVSPEFRKLLNIGNTTTRASTIVASDALDTDVRFDQPGESVPHERTLSPEQARLASARESGVGALSLVLLARALRRRARRRST